MASMIEIAGYAYTAGLRNPGKIAMAVAIAEAESGGNVKAYNGKGRDDSYGLWQINMKAHTTAELGIGSKDALYDPVTNARAMVKISKSGSSWSPWTTYPLRRRGVPAPGDRGDCRVPGEPGECRPLRGRWRPGRRGRDRGRRVGLHPRPTRYRPR
jgi:hypothetical protein